MPDKIDLHIHSNHSDGLQTPVEIVDRSLQLSLKAISIVDHDSVSGFEEVKDYAADKGIELISGIELSASETDDDIHLLGYLFDPQNDRLQKSLEKFRQIRQERGKKMIARLAAMDMIMDYDDLLEAAGGAVVGRPHLAEAMLKKGFIGSYREAFDKYLHLGGPVYVPKAKLTPAEAIELIHDAGGVVVMAHPALTNRDEMIDKLAEYGLDGLEVFHPVHKGPRRRKYRKIAQRLDLIITGGSDSHNRKGRYGDIGEEDVPYDCLVELKKRWQKNNKL